MSIELVTQVPDPNLYLTPDSPIAGLQFYSITSPSFAPRCVGQRPCAAAVEQGEPLSAGTRGKEGAGKQVLIFLLWFTSKLILPLRWQLVVSALTSAPITSSRELEQAIMSYNTRYKDKYDWSFDGLHHLFEEVLEPEETDAFFGTTMPGMIELLTASPSILTSPLPLLKAGKSHSITLSQQQVHC